MANDTGATEPYPLRMTPREKEIVRETAEFNGCSLNTAIRFLIRRGYDWSPHPRPDGTYERHPETRAPVDGRLTFYPPEAEWPDGGLPTTDVPKGQTAIDLEKTQ
jgi:hypothetical protein